MATTLNIQELAALVRARRGARGLRTTAQEIGGMSASTLSRVEQGKLPDLDTFLRLCRWLGVPPEHFAAQPTLGMEGTTPLSDVDPHESRQDIITAHLRADRTLNPETAEALVTMIRLAYQAIERGELGIRKEG